MKKTALFYFLIITSVYSELFSQNEKVIYLKSVEINNIQLISAKSLTDARILEQKTMVNIQDPMVEYAYLPGNSDAIGVKSTFGVSQEFDFPTVYITRKKRTRNNIKSIHSDYQEIRREILLKAALNWNQYIYLNKLLAEYQKRLDNAVKMYTSYSAKLEKGTASILDVNKAKILYLSSKNKHANIRQELENLYKEMVLINGGKEFKCDFFQYTYNDLQPIEEIKEELINNHPHLYGLESRMESAKLNASIKKQEWLPTINIGYEAENEPDGIYSGIRAGISIPLWQKKNTVNYANAQYKYTQSVYYLNKEQIIIELEINYNKCLQNKSMLNEYDEILQTNIDIQYIEKALNLGQISIIEYINELTMYYEIVDLYLQTEKNFHQNLIKLYSFKL